MTSHEPFERPDQPGAPRHGLRWGIKASFLDYVRRMPGSRGTIGDGAEPVGAAEVLWSLGPRPPAATMPDATHAWAFVGDVRFSGHGGMMFVRLAAPAVEVGPAGARLTIAGERDDAPRLPLADLTLARHETPETEADGVELWMARDVRLTAAGAGLFNDVYAAGEPLEPLTLVVPVGSGALD